MHIEYKMFAVYGAASLIVGSVPLAMNIPGTTPSVQQEAQIPLAEARRIPIDLGAPDEISSDELSPDEQRSVFQKIDVEPIVLKMDSDTPEKESEFKIDAAQIATFVNNLPNSTNPQISKLFKQCIQDSITTVINNEYSTPPSVISHVNMMIDFENKLGIYNRLIEEIQKLQEINKEQREHFEQEQAKYAELHRQNTETIRRLEGAQAQDALQKQYDLLVEKFEDMQQQKQNAMLDRAQFESQAKAYKERIDEQRARIFELSTKIDVQNQSQMMQIMQMAQQNPGNEAWQKELLDAVKNNNSTQGRVESEYQDQIDELKEQLKTVIETGKESTKQFQESQQLKEVLQNQGAQGNQKLLEMLQEKNKELKETYDGMLLYFTTQGERHVQEIQAYRQQHLEDKSTIAVLNKQVEILQQRLQQKGIREDEEFHQQMTEHIKKLGQVSGDDKQFFQDEIKKLFNQSNQTRGQEREAMESEIQQLSGKIETLQNMNNHQQTELKSANQKLLSTITEVKTTQGQVRSENEKELIEKLRLCQEQKNSLNETIASLNARLQEIQAQNKMYKESMEATNKTNKELYAENAALAKTNAELRSGKDKELQEQLKGLRELVSQDPENPENKAFLEKILEAVNQTNETQGKEMNDWEKQVQGISDQVNQLSKRNTTLLDTIEETNANNAELRQQIIQFVDKDEELQRLQQENGQLKGQNASLREQLQRLQSEQMQNIADIAKSIQGLPDEDALKAELKEQLQELTETKGRDSNRVAQQIAQIVEANENLQRQLTELKQAPPRATAGATAGATAARATEEYDEKVKELEEQMQLVARLREQILGHEQEKTQNTSKIAEYNENMQKLSEGTISVASLKINQENKKLKQQLEDILSTSEETKEKTIITLQDANDQLSSQISEMKEELSVLNERNRTLQSDNETLLEQQEKAISQEAQQELLEKLQASEQKHERLAQSYGRIAKMIGPQRNVVDADVADLDENALSRANQIATLETQLAILRQNITNVRDRYNADLKRMADTYSAEKTKLFSELNDLRQSDARRAKVMATTASDQQKLEQQNIQIKHLQEMQKTEEVAAPDFSEKITELESSIEVLEDSNAEYTAQVQQLKQNNRELQTAYDTSEKLQKDLRQQILDYRAEIQTLKQTTVQLDRSLKDQTANNKKLTDLLQTADASYNTLLRKYEQEMKERGDHEARLEVQNAELEQSFKSLAESTGYVEESQQEGYKETKNPSQFEISVEKVMQSRARQLDEVLVQVANQSKELNDLRVLERHWKEQEESLKSELDSAQKEAIAEKNKQRTFLTQLQKLSAGTNAIKQQFTRERKEWDKELRIKGESIESLKETNRILEVNQKRLESERDALKENVLNLQGQFTTYDNFSKEMTTLSTSLTSRNEELFTQVAVLKQQIANMSQEKSDLQLKLDQLNAASKQKDIQIDELKLQPQVVSANVSEQQIIDELEQKKRDLEVKVAELTAANEKLQTDLRHANERIEHLKHENGQLRDQIERLEENLSKERAKNDRLSNELGIANENNKKLIAEKAELEKKNKELQDELDEIMNEDNENLKKAQKDLQDAQAKIKRQEQQITNLKSTNRRLKTRIKALEKTEKRLKKDKEQLLAKIDEIRKQNNKFKEQRDDARDKLKNVEPTIKAKNKEIDEIKERLKNEQTKASRATQDYDETSKALTQAKTDHKTKIQKLIEEEKKKQEDLNEQIRKEKSQNTELDRKLRLAEEEVSRRKKQIDQLRARLSEQPDAPRPAPPPSPRATRETSLKQSIARQIDNLADVQNYEQFFDQLKEALNNIIIDTIGIDSAQWRTIGEAINEVAIMYHQVMDTGTNLNNKFVLKNVRTMINGLLNISQRLKNKSIIENIEAVNGRMEDLRQAFMRSMAAMQSLVKKRASTPTALAAILNDFDNFFQLYMRIGARISGLDDTSYEKDSITAIFSPLVNLLLSKQQSLTGHNEFFNSQLEMIEAASTRKKCSPDDLIFYLKEKDKSYHLIGVVEKVNKDLATVLTPKSYLKSLKGDEQEEKDPSADEPEEAERFQIDINHPLVRIEQAKVYKLICKDIWTDYDVCEHIMKQETDAPVWFRLLRNKFKANVGEFVRYETKDTSLKFGIVLARTENTLSSYNIKDFTSNKIHNGVNPWSLLSSVSAYRETQFMKEMRKEIPKLFWDQKQLQQWAIQTLNFTPQLLIRELYEILRFTTLTAKEYHGVSVITEWVKDSAISVVEFLKNWNKQDFLQYVKKETWGEERKRKAAHAMLVDPDEPSELGQQLQKGLTTAEAQMGLEDITSFINPQSASVPAVQLPAGIASPEEQKQMQKRF